LLSWWSIFEPKWHDHPNEGSPIGDECNLVLIFKGDHDLVIIKKFIQEQNRSHALPLRLTPFSVKGKGYGSFLVATLSFRKSMQILNMQFLFGITTVGYHQLASSTGVG